ncbi:DnaJ domain-containing protein [Nitrospira sp. Nam74]
MGTRKDYYAVLGVSKTEAERGIHGAYRRLAKECHPDRAGDQGTEKFQEIQEAYEVLSDPARRSRYDQDTTPVWRRERPPAEPLVRPRPASFNEPEPLIPSESAVEYLHSLSSRAKHRVDVRLAYSSCFSGVFPEEALSHLIAQYLYLARRGWF